MRRDEFVRRFFLPHVLTLSLLTSLAGCESLQRKFTRRAKHPKPAPSPIIRFEDYTRSMTPLDRYRKHYMMFDYWSGDLLDAVDSPTPNSKRYRKASAEALAELETLQSLLADDLAAGLAPIIEERRRIDQELAHDSALSQTSGLVRRLEAQERQIHRQFFWRDVQDRLKEE